MLAVGLKQAKAYDKSPILIARSQNNEKHDLYYCLEGILPCQNCASQNPLELLSKKEIYELKRKYKVSSRLLKSVEETYRDNKDSVDIGSEVKSLSGRIFIESLERRILNKLKKEIRLPTANWLPFIDPLLLKKINQHVFLTGPSGCGKTTMAA